MVTLGAVIFRLIIAHEDSTVEVWTWRPDPLKGRKRLERPPSYVPQHGTDRDRAGRAHGQDGRLFPAAVAGIFAPSHCSGLARGSCFSSLHQGGDVIGQISRDCAGTRVSLRASPGRTRGSATPGNTKAGYWMGGSGSH
jgi:hypothetical protein